MTNIINRLIDFLNRFDAYYFQQPRNSVTLALGAVLILVGSFIPLLGILLVIAGIAVIVIDVYRHTIQ